MRKNCLNVHNYFKNYHSNNRRPKYWRHNYLNKNSSLNKRLINSKKQSNSINQISSINNKKSNSSFHWSTKKKWMARKQLDSWINSNSRLLMLTPKKKPLKLNIKRWWRNSSKRYKSSSRQYNHYKHKHIKALNYMILLIANILWRKRKILKFLIAT